jgi:hypothetical protein
LWNVPNSQARLNRLPSRLPQIAAMTDTSEHARVLPVCHSAGKPLARVRRDSSIERRVPNRDTCRRRDGPKLRPCLSAVGPSGAELLLQVSKEIAHDPQHWPSILDVEVAMHKSTVNAAQPPKPKPPPPRPPRPPAPPPGPMNPRAG